MYASCNNHIFYAACINDCKIAPGTWKHKCAVPRLDGRLVFAYTDIEDASDGCSQRQLALLALERERLPPSI